MGAESLKNAQVTRWAEETASQVEGVLGMPIPVTSMNPVEIRLPVPGLTSEELVRIVVARIVAERRRDAGLARAEIQIPAWFSAGLAGNLDKAMPAYHRQVLAGLGDDVSRTGIREIMGWYSLPEGWHGRQALCSLATAWVLSHPGSLDKLLNRLMTQEPVSPEWLAEAVVGAATVSVMESRWRAWRDRQDRTVQDLGELSLDLIGQLRALCVLDSGTRRFDPEEAIDARKQNPVIVTLAHVKIQQIQALTMGKAPELVEVGELYCRFYEGLVKGSWGFVLRRKLDRADSSLDRLESLTRQREAYLDAFEREYEIRASSEPERSVLEKSRMESYVDEAERRLDKRQDSPP